MILKYVDEVIGVFFEFGIPYALVYTPDDEQIKNCDNSGDQHEYDVKVLLIPVEFCTHVVPFIDDHIVFIFAVAINIDNCGDHEIFLKLPALLII